ncbi:MAG TPA: hydrogenase small subunit [Coriobacteriia bacterium]|nr:hydrogenase small subunit [Coriobacteriia bacterium]
MTHGDHDAIYDLLAARGVSRRDFLKYCGSLAAVLGLSEAFVPQIAAAVNQGAKLKPAVWLGGGLCTGCTESLAQVDSPDVATIVLELLSLNFSKTLSMAQGEDAMKAAKDTFAEPGYILIYEGAVMEGWDGNANRIAGDTGLHELDLGVPNAGAIIAVGSCAVDGGFVAAHPNPAKATGVKHYLEAKGIATPVINLPTCPVSPEAIVAVVVDVLLLGTLETGAILDKLDDWGRPKYIFSQTIHDNCPRRGHFENGHFVSEFGTEEEALGYCLYKVGCKGPQTFNQCPVVRWNRRASWCVESGAPCIGCGSLSWVDVGAPFLNRHRDLPLPVVGNTQPSTIAYAVAGIAAAGIGVHALGMKLAGRMDGEGAPYEEMKDYDKKRMKKGGGN